MLLLKLYNILFLSLLLLACNEQQKSKAQSAEIVDAYDLSQPEKFKLPHDLNEISGISFDGNDKTIYSIQDEDGKLFHFQLGSNKKSETSFGKDGDYEDVQVCNNFIVVLRSDGTLFTFPKTEASKKKADNVVEFKKILPGGEYEGLYADTKTNKIYALCKHCNETLTETCTGYILSLDKEGNLKTESSFIIDVKAIAAKAGVKKLNFQPSALAKNLQTNEWFILSSVNKCLVTATADFTIKEVYKLDAAIYAQPEGIAFDADNNLYISNEKNNTEAATILKLKTNNK